LRDDFAAAERPAAFLETVRLGVRGAFLAFLTFLTVLLVLALADFFAVARAFDAAFDAFDFAFDAFCAFDAFELFFAISEPLGPVAIGG
jgi:hypothetical protein